MAYARSLRALAKEVGLSHQRLAELRDNRGLPLEKGPDGYDVAVVFRWLRDNLEPDPAKLAGANGNGGENPENENAKTPLLRRRKLIEEIRAKRAGADKAEIELEVRRGELVEIAQVKDRDLERIQIFTRHLSSLEAPIAARMAGKGDREIRAIWRDVVREIRHRLSEDGR